MCRNGKAEYKKTLQSPRYINELDSNVAQIVVKNCVNEMLPIRQY